MVVQLCAKRLQRNINFASSGCTVKGAGVEGVTKEWDAICEIRQWNEDFQ